MNEQGRFCCGKHRRNQICNDCFHVAVSNDNDRRAMQRALDRAVKGIWRKIYLKEGDEVPWSEDEEEDEDEDQDEESEWEECEEEEESPSEDVEQQTEKSSSSSREKTCAHCGRVGKLDRCAKCKVTFYCSRSHQIADYAIHKAHCQGPKALVNDSAQPTKTRHETVLS